MRTANNTKSGEKTSLDALYRKRDKALERVVAAYKDLDKRDDGEELDRALDALTVAHAAATFEWASGR
jgi:hypothetical protein